MKIKNGGNSEQASIIQLMSKPKLIQISSQPHSLTGSSVQQTGARQLSALKIIAITLFT